MGRAPSPALPLPADEVAAEGSVSAVGPGCSGDPGAAGHGENWGSPGLSELDLGALPCWGAPANTDRGTAGTLSWGRGCALLEVGDTRDRVNPPALSQTMHERSLL